MKRPLSVVHKGRTGNRLFQYFFCSELARRAGTHYVADVSIPDLAIRSEPGPPCTDGFLHIEGKHEFDLSAIAMTLRESAQAGATFSGYAARVEYYDRDQCRSLLNLHPDPGLGFGPEFLVINIRAGDIVQGPTLDLMSSGYGRPYALSDLHDGIHPDYRPLPLSFYERLIRDTRLKPVFVGETDSHTDYGIALRKRFPGAVFTGRQSPREDFLTLTGSAHLVLAVSTFSWLAGWFSGARTIHLPIAGFLDPLQRPDVNLIPSPSDARYILHPFPRVRWQGTADQVAELFA
jgi:Glycosyl transferase family 11